MNMSDPALHVCLDVPLSDSPSAIAEAEAKAAAEHATGGPLSPIEAALVKAKKWRKGRTLKVRFLDGDPDLQQEGGRRGDGMDSSRQHRLGFQ